MKQYIKTAISRQKLYEKNYNRDSIEIIEDDEKIEIVDRYKALVGILTRKYEDDKKR